MQVDNDDGEVMPGHPPSEKRTLEGFICQNLLCLVVTLIFMVACQLGFFFLGMNTSITLLIFVGCAIVGAFGLIVGLILKWIKCDGKSFHAVLIEQGLFSGFVDAIIVPFFIGAVICVVGIIIGIYSTEFYQLYFIGPENIEPNYDIKKVNNAYSYTFDPNYVLSPALIGEYDFGCSNNLKCKTCVIPAGLTKFVPNTTHPTNPFDFWFSCFISVSHSQTCVQVFNDSSPPECLLAWKMEAQLEGIRLTEASLSQYKTAVQAIQAVEQRYGLTQSQNIIVMEKVKIDDKKIISFLIILLTLAGGNSVFIVVFIARWIWGWNRVSKKVHGYAPLTNVTN